MEEGQVLYHCIRPILRSSFRRPLLKRSQLALSAAFTFKFSVLILCSGRVFFAAECSGQEISFLGLSMYPDPWFRLECRNALNFLALRK